MEHKCIKCGVSYTDDELDDYYCPSCNEQRLAVAKEIDIKVASRPKREAKSDNKILEETGKLPATANGSYIFLMNHKK